ncbi:MAG TPA: trypsin-like peptidase domain-containing protein [Chloroflexota bacterium]|nr:trypsin-like peptidase domain-containing protein [Chloroflexota bacterium]
MATILDEIQRASATSTELGALAERLAPSVVAVLTPRSTGSGVIWNDTGVVVTNHHVVPGEQAEVLLVDGRRWPAAVTARSERLDLAALQTKGDSGALGRQAATVGDSSKIRPGELVVAMGNPYGERNALTLGVVIARTSDSGEDDERIQAAVSLRPGNSGGALADVRGRVVGIPHLIVGGGLALSVPSNAVNRFLQMGGASGDRLGIFGRSVELPRLVRERNNVSDRPGLLILGIQANSLAERAGLQLGDVLIDVPGSSFGELSRWGSVTAGQSMRLAALRGGDLRWVEVRRPQ